MQRHATATTLMHKPMPTWIEDMKSIVAWQQRHNIPVVWICVPVSCSDALQLWLDDASNNTHDPQLLARAAPPRNVPPQDWKWHALDARHAHTVDHRTGWLDALDGLPDVVEELRSIPTSMEQ